MKVPPDLFLSIDGWSDSNSKSVLNALNGGPLPLEGEKKSTVNLGKFISGMIDEFTADFQQKIPGGGCEDDACRTVTDRRSRVLGFVSESPHVMSLTRDLITGRKPGRSSCCKFSFGCSCHALSNSVKDVYKTAFVRTTSKAC